MLSNLSRPKLRVGGSVQKTEVKIFDTVMWIFYHLKKVVSKERVTGDDSG